MLWRLIGPLGNCPCRSTTMGHGEMSLPFNNHGPQENVLAVQQPWATGKCPCRSTTMGHREMSLPFNNLEIFSNSRHRFGLLSCSRLISQYFRWFWRAMWRQSWFVSPELLCVVLGTQKLGSSSIENPELLSASSLTPQVRVWNISFACFARW